VAIGIVAFYLGVDLLHQLDPTESPADRLFDHASRLAPALGTLIALEELGMSYSPRSRGTSRGLVRENPRPMGKRANSSG
jgi:hypothetical protein